MGLPGKAGKPGLDTRILLATALFTGAAAGVAGWNVLVVDEASDRSVVSSSCAPLFDALAQENELLSAYRDTTLTTQEQKSEAERALRAVEGPVNAAFSRCELGLVWSDQPQEVESWRGRLEEMHGRYYQQQRSQLGLSFSATEAPDLTPEHMVAGVRLFIDKLKDPDEVGCAGDPEKYMDAVEDEVDRMAKEAEAS